MKTVYLNSSIVIPNCSRITWCIRPETSVNKIQKLILEYNSKGERVYPENIV